VTKSQITEKLRRDDLQLRACDIDLFSTVEESRDFGHEPSVIMVSLREIDETILEQCLEELADFCVDLGAEYVYVPLSFGPIQEVSR
jgi:hypothetical protein